MAGELEQEYHFMNEQRLDNGPWQALERGVARLLQHGGFKDVTVVGGTGDLGADVVTTSVRQNP